ncbi:DNA-binding response regulator [Photorhabdus temperata]|uniref:Two component transcriptional regulator, LuxR family n=2 Tax=Photorhabdus khanii TaxID=1004150 RepID=W3V9C6_9GAMM|nr:response regulator [Photorhabdus khanii]ETS31720.1 two component transcriptional regulator, LuxR family [Photorhabdus khanii NC19]MQL49082.1 response regulator [Photorhabdus khanii]OHV51061.1 DNA-binding response regulator [Photorhabdus temperata]
MAAVIYLIDDDEAIRDSISMLLETMNWSVTSFPGAQEFLDDIDKTNISDLQGCILLDIRMPGKPGLTLHDELLKLNNTLPVIIMTGHGNIDICRRAFKNGAFEFLTKPIDADLLIETVSNALLSHQEIFKQCQIYKQLKTKFSQLSERESEVMEIILEGKTSKQIAQQLALSPRTIEVHRANIFHKLDIHSLPQLVKEYELFKSLSYV